MSPSETDYLRLQKELSAGKIRGSYLFTGDEDFLMDEAVEAVCSHLFPAEQRSAGFSRVDGREHSLEQVLDLAETVSLFADARLVVVPDAPYFSKGQEISDVCMDRLLATGVGRGSGSTIIFYVLEMPKNKNQKKLAAAGAIYNFQPFRQRELYDWLQGRISANGKSASQKALTILVERVGRDLRRLSSEIDKLCTYLGHEPLLDEECVLTATTRSLQGDIFALIDTVISGRTSKALTQLHALLSFGEPPLRILAMLVRQFRLIGESQDLLRRGCPTSELAVRLSLHPYAAEVLARQAQNTEQSWLGTCVDLLLQADLDIKRGRANQRLVLETLVIALGQSQKSA